MLEKIINKKSVTIAVGLILFLIVFSLSFLFSQARELEIEYPEIGGFKIETVGVGLENYVFYIFSFFVRIFGFIIFGLLVYAGFLYLTSTGQPARLKEARDTIISAFWGILLLLSGYIILTTINPELKFLGLPGVEKPKVCEGDKDCPRGYFCTAEKDKCKMVSSCFKDEDCPYTYKCIENKCEKQKEKATAIFWEFPLGTMLEDELWNEDKTNKIETLIKEIDVFFKKEIKPGDSTFNKISDLNKYLESLTTECRCEEVQTVCQKPENFAQPVGCVGDPCTKVRDKINKVLKINQEKIEELKNFKKKLVELKDIQENKGREFRNLTENLIEECKKKEILTQPEYYETISTIEKEGGVVELKKVYPVPFKKDEPLMFYCPVGGSTFEQPSPQEELIKEGDFSEKAAKPISGEDSDFGVGHEAPLYCPVVFPIGELMDYTVLKTYEYNTNLETLIFYFDEIIAKVMKLTELVSQCNESRCQVDCACIRNLCYKKCAPFPPNLCFPFCKSPCIQAIGGCYGEPCPRQKIIETVQLIKIYEDEILGKDGQAGLLEAIKKNIKGGQNVFKNKGNKIDLNVIRKGMEVCFALSKYPLEIAEEVEDVEEEEFQEDILWNLLPCSLAIGNQGPGDNIITACHPQDFFCCSYNPSDSTLKEFPKQLFEQTSIYPTAPEVVSSPSTYGYNNVPYFSQLDERWRNKDFGCGVTIGRAGCGPTAIAMALNFAGINIDPPSVANLILEKNYRVCGHGISSDTTCKIAKKKNVKCKEFPGDIKSVLNELENNKNVVAVVSGRGAPPYTGGGHYIVLTGIREEWGQKFVYFNDPYYYPGDPYRSQLRPAEGRKPIEWFESQGIGAGAVIYK